MTTWARRPERATASLTARLPSERSQAQLSGTIPILDHPCFGLDAVVAREETAVAGAIRVVAAVFVDDDRILACRRRVDRSSPGLWEFPGGKVESPETAEAALAREIREELGIDIAVHGPIDRSQTVLGHVTIDLSSYWVTAVGALPTHSTDHDQLRWLSPADLHTLAWSIPDLQTVRKLSPTAPKAGT